jgi:hypothetical protein
MWKAGGTEYAYLHNHTLSDAANLTFSGQDQKLIANNRIRNYYLITITGLVMYMDKYGTGVNQVPRQVRHFTPEKN